MTDFARRMRLWAMGGSLVLGILAVAMPSVAQDTTTMLSKFLVDLRNGTLGTVQAISTITTTGTLTTTSPTVLREASGQPQLFYRTTGSGTNLAAVARVNSTPNNIITGSATDDFAIRNSQRIIFSANDGTTLHLAINSGGTQSWSATAFASLGTPANGTFTYCNDCTIANPCAGSGTGALAKRLNGAWVCN